MDTQTDTSLVYTFPQWSSYWIATPIIPVGEKNMKKPETTNPPTKNLRLVQAFLENPLTAPLAEDVVLQDLAQNCTYRRRSDVHRLLRAFFEEGFSEVKTTQQTLLADEKSAVVEFVFYGVHKGVFLSIPATGQRVVIPMVLVCHITGGSICRISWYYDAGTLLRQLRLAL